MTKQEIAEKWDKARRKDMNDPYSTIKTYLISALTEFETQLAPRLKAARELAEKVNNFELLNELAYDEMAEDLYEMKTLARQITGGDDGVL